MGLNGRKFRLLLWKNYILKLRHPLQLFLQITIPFLFCSPVLLTRSLEKIVDHLDGTIFKPFNISLNLTVLGSTNTLLYSPCNNTHLDSVMQNVMNPLKKKCVANGAILDREIAINEEVVTAGVKFNDSLAGNVPLPKQIHMVFRFPSETRSVITVGEGNWVTTTLFKAITFTGPRNHEANDGANPSYSQEGFLSLQKDISISLINSFKKLKDHTTDDLNVNILMQRMPYPPWFEDPMLTLLKEFIAIMIVSSFLLCATSTVKALTDEKETQIKEAMKIMGLPNWLHWLAWYIQSLVIFMGAGIIMIIIFKIKIKQHATFSHADYSVLLVFMFLFSCASITLCFAISTFFSKANTASTGAVLLWYAFYFPYQITINRHHLLSLNEKLALCLASNSAFSFGFIILINFEIQGTGIQWSNVFSKSEKDEPITLGNVMIMLIIDTIIYMLIALYVEAVFPGEYGVPKPWYFFLTKSYWCGKQKYVGVTDDKHQPDDPNMFEKEPQMKKGVEIKRLRKKFANNKIVVRDLSLNLYEDQITVLLGHNGAGKTTTMSMLTGLFPPTSGTATINGYDIVTNIDKVRDSLGLCPQYNVIFKELTVYEHLYFFGRLKGVEKKEIKGEINKYINLLELTQKKNTQAQNLSGGTKRKLCTAIALCGKSKVVFLDEPTAGVDPSARRTVWNLLQSEKKGRTILLSTHFMDEADLLGDRIAIMAGGKLQSCGTSFFLKKKFGAGYHLILEKQQKCRIEDITELLSKYIPGLKVESVVGSELSYDLPDDKSSVFEPMLRELENKSAKLGIASYGISLTTLEEVFMSLGADKGQEEMLSGKNEIMHSELDSDTVLNLDDNNYETGFKLYLNQIKAIAIKRILSSYRSWALLVIQFLIATSFVILTMVLLKDAQIGKELKPFKYTLLRYSHMKVTCITSGSNKYQPKYKELINKNFVNIIDLPLSNLQGAIIERAKENLFDYKWHYLIGGEFKDEKTVVAHFNNDPVHTPPLALKTMMDAILKTELGDDYDIDFTFDPVPYTLQTKFFLLNLGVTIGGQLATNISFAMSFISAYFIIFYIRERSIGAKHLQVISGASINTFWSISYLWDLILFSIINICVIITVACFQENGFKTGSDMGRLFLCLLLFSIAVLPLTYILSFLFEVPSSGFIYVATLNVFLGVVTFMLVTIFCDKQLRLKETAKILHWIFLCLPHYSLNSAILNINTAYSICKFCIVTIDACALTESVEYCKMAICLQNPSCCNTQENYYEWEQPGILKNIVFLIIFTVTAWVCLLLIEYGIIKIITYKVMAMVQKPQELSDDEDKDDDVKREKMQIRSLSNDQLKKYTLVLKDVTKFYKDIAVVHQLSVGIKSYECFGLLGVNGAGKTTTFKMMTGLEKITYGDAWVKGLNLKTSMKEVYKSIGYCPQFDALLDDLTGRETIIIFGLLRGINYNESKHLADKLARELEFKRHLDKKVKQYSGGNKRKLSTALALLGNPQLIYLDEPTTGMDPSTKRHVWNMINKLRDAGKCIILTSHSMEECEALCTRLAIMVNGTFRCLGSIQHLKSKFSQGYTLTIKIKKVDQKHLLEQHVQNIEEFIETQFPSAELRESYLELMTYYIPDSSTPWSKIFGIMERAKKQLYIEDYSLGQSSLEQVFLLFTKIQRTESTFLFKFNK